MITTVAVFTAIKNVQSYFRVGFGNKVDNLMSGTEFIITIIKELKYKIEKKITVGTRKRFSI